MRRGTRRAGDDHARRHLDGHPGRSRETHEGRRGQGAAVTTSVATGKLWFVLRVVRLAGPKLLSEGRSRGHVWRQRATRLRKHLVAAWEAHTSQCFMLATGVLSLACEVLTIPKFNPKLHLWTPKEDALVGTVTDPAL